MKIRITGTKELQKTLKQLGKPFMNEVGDGIVRTSTKHMKRIYARKQDSGNLRKSIYGRWIKSSLRGFVRIGNESTMRRSGKRQPINYAKFIEEGFRGHSFPAKDINPHTNELENIKKKYVKVSGFEGLHGMRKSAEKTRKELGSISKKAFDVVVTKR